MDLSTPVDKQYRLTNVFVVGQESETTGTKQIRKKEPNPKKNESQKRLNSIATADSLTPEASS